MPERNELKFDIDGTARQLLDELEQGGTVNQELRTQLVKRLSASSKDTSTQNSTSITPETKNNNSIWPDNEDETLRIINERPTSELSSEQKDILIALFHDIGSYRFTKPMSSDSYQEDLKKIQSLCSLRGLGVIGVIEFLGHFVNNKQDTVPQEQVKELTKNLTLNVNNSRRSGKLTGSFFLKEALLQTFTKALEDLEN